MVVESESHALKTSSDVVALFDRYVAPTYGRSLVLVRGQGTEVWDAEGTRYLDFSGGVAVNALGHAHPAIVEALQRQAATLIHASNLYYTEPQGRLAERIVGAMGAGKVFFANSGAEANEAVFKLARKYGSSAGRFEIITAEGSFHGRTLGGISASGQEKLRAGFGPLLPGFVHAPFNDLDAVRAAVTERTVAIHVEGIQGEIGIVPAQADFLLGLRELCDERDLLLTFDAVQCGMFRTGAFQSYMRILENEAGADDFRPDAVAMAKGLGGGFPIGATWLRDRVADTLQAGSHGSTFGGNPLACAVAMAVWDVIEREGLAQNARRQGERLMSHLAALQAAHGDLVVDVRGLGLMIGVEVARGAKELLVAAREEGLLLVPSGRPALRLLPPLTVRDAECDEAVERLAAALGRI